MSNNSNIAPNWASYRKLWKLVAIILFIILFLMFLLGCSPLSWWSDKCSSTTDNPEHLTRIGLLEKENAELTKSNGLVAGLQAKVKALEAVDMNFVTSGDNADLLAKISSLETANGLIPGLQAKIKALEGVDMNFIKPADNTDLLTKISNLEKANGLIPGLQAKIKALEEIDVNFIKPADNTDLLTKINSLEKANGLIPGLQAKIKALEGIDVNFIKPADNSDLLARISELEKANGLIPGLQAKIKALEAIDINFIQQGSVPSMPLPDTAKLYFSSDSYNFPTDENGDMSKVLSYMRLNSSSKASLVGFHDATGSSAWNKELASLRSNRVRQTLLDAGISSNRIRIEKPSQTLGTGVPREARRVEVRVFN